MLCANCGTEATGSFCHNCGSALNKREDQIQQVTSGTNTNLMALIGFILGCVSFFLNFWGIVGIVALVFSVVGLVQIKNTQGSGKAVAITGIVLGGVSIFYGFSTLLLMGSLFG